MLSPRSTRCRAAPPPHGPPYMAPWSVYAHPGSGAGYPTQVGVLKCMRATCRLATCSVAVSGVKVPGSCTPSVSCAPSPLRRAAPSSPLTLPCPRRTKDSTLPRTHEPGVLGAGAPCTPQQPTPPTKTTTLPPQALPPVQLHPPAPNTTHLPPCPPRRAAPAHGRLSQEALTTTRSGADPEPHLREPEPRRGANTCKA